MEKIIIKKYDRYSIVKGVTDKVADGWFGGYGCFENGCDGNDEEYKAYRICVARNTNSEMSE